MGKFRIDFGTEKYAFALFYQQLRLGRSRIPELRFPIIFWVAQTKMLAIGMQLMYHFIQGTRLYFEFKDVKIQHLPI